ncbi:Tripeptidyl-peptidase sed3 [Labeo rohita]|uniref:Tripeptidyl-peptidase sed3 n=1 Tax=Labeo rohita TaxID=84645 RepID=A0ABQ8LY99_LABRO|nr:Tripeptidyl-peptidase sed3 [Labeo rohita]
MPPLGGITPDSCPGPVSSQAYMASGQAAFTLHAMAILQVYWTKVLQDLHKVDPDPELVQELRLDTNYALRATKATAQALGRAMSTMVVQERYLWPNMAEMWDAEKVHFLDAPRLVFSVTPLKTRNGFGFIPAVCPLADSHHMVNKRAISFFSGSFSYHFCAWLHKAP